METKIPPNFWWVKSSAKQPLTQESEDNGSQTIPRLELDISSSLADFLQKEQNVLSSKRDDNTEVDVGSIIEEINRVAAQSPLGPFNHSTEERSIEDIMKEAEKIYLESSKSFEQLSQRSKTSQNITELHSSSSKDSTPTPKSVSPLPLDSDVHESETECDSYSEDFSNVSKVETIPSPIIENLCDNVIPNGIKDLENPNKNSVQDDVNKCKTDKVVSDNNSEVFTKKVQEQTNTVNQNKTFDVNDIAKKSETVTEVNNQTFQISSIMNGKLCAKNNEEMEKYKEEISFKDRIINTLEVDNSLLRRDVQQVKLQLQETNELLEKTRIALSAKAISSPEINLEIEKALEDLKDSKEINTALQLQLDGLNKTHVLLKNSYDELINSNTNLERRVLELDTTLSKYKSELLNVQKSKDKLLENEISLTKLLEIEKLQAKSLKLQNEKDARCIQDLNRQIKEMERIIARKHPDSVSALIVAAKNDATDSNLTARKVLEDRIKTLEEEAFNRDSQSSKIFLDIQEKFNQMKIKYESHIEDLELHVNDLKNQLKKKTDTYDVYTQTFFDEQKIPQKDTLSIYTQTDPLPSKSPKPAAVRRNEKLSEPKEETHLIATIRGLQADLSNKEKVLAKLQREIDEVKKTNRRLQKEREGSLKNLSDRKEFRSYPEKLANHVKPSGSYNDVRLEEEVKVVKAERDKMKQQLCRLEEDYQALKNKRLHDLNALQEAHEREIANYVATVTPLREQLEVQQITITNLQSQLSTAKEELSIVTIERDHLNNRLLNGAPCKDKGDVICDSNSNEVESLVKKVAFMEKRYQEREHRLRAIVHGLAQKNVTNRSCEQCAARQQQLIGYKVELDQLLATLRALQ